MSNLMYKANGSLVDLDKLHQKTQVVVSEKKSKPRVSENFANDNNIKNNYMYYPEETIIYHDVFNALGKVFGKSGSPAEWDETSHKTALWNGRKIIRLGGNSKPLAFPNGAFVNVPNNMNVIWLRVLSDRWFSVKVYTEGGADIGTFIAGFNNLNKYAPDGGSGDSYWNVHDWMAIPVPKAGKYILVPGNKKNDGGSDTWISGIAFSTNPWNHAYNSAVAYHWAVNEGTQLTWNNQNWNNGQLAQLDHPKKNILYIPVVPSGKDKLLYLVEHNNNWDGIMHQGIKVEDVPIERFRTTWDNPFARHHNSKIYSRFVATRVPEKLTIGKRFLKVEIDSSLSNNNIFIREAGTIDFVDTVDNTKQDLINTKEDLVKTKQELMTTKQDLNSAKQDLNSTKQDLNSTKQDLNSAKQTVANLGVQVANMGKSIKNIQETPVKSGCVIS